MRALVYFAEEIPVFRFEFLHRLVEFSIEQFGGGFFGLREVGGHEIQRDGQAQHLEIRHSSFVIRISSFF